MRARRGYNVTIVALARKILCILYHLLINQETYEEEARKPRASNRRVAETVGMAEMSLETMIDLIRQSGYVVTRNEGSACG